MNKRDRRIAEQERMRDINRRASIVHSMRNTNELHESCRGVKRQPKRAKRVSVWTSHENTRIHFIDKPVTKIISVK